MGGEKKKKHLTKINTEKLCAIDKQPQERGKREPISSTSRAGPAHIHDSVYLTQLQTIVQHSLCMRYSRSFCDVTLRNTDNG